jgi:hypothetical protein
MRLVILFMLGLSSSLRLTSLWTALERASLIQVKLGAIEAGSSWSKDGGPTKGSLWGAAGQARVLLGHAPCLLN